MARRACRAETFATYEALHRRYRDLAPFLVYFRPRPKEHCARQVCARVAGVVVECTNARGVQCFIEFPVDLSTDPAVTRKLWTPTRTAIQMHLALMTDAGLEVPGAPPTHNGYNSLSYVCHCGELWRLSHLLPNPYRLANAAALPANVSHWPALVPTAYRDVPLPGRPWAFEKVGNSTPRCSKKHAGVAAAVRKRRAARHPDCPAATTTTAAAAAAPRESSDHESSSSDDESSDDESSSSDDEEPLCFPSPATLLRQLKRDHGSTDDPDRWAARVQDALRGDAGWQE